MGSTLRYVGLAEVLHEMPESSLLADIRHWIRVYQELRVVARQIGALDLAAECDERLSFWLAKTDGVRLSSN